ncbi:MAG: hypothetical protein H6667_07545 [Ardenticatenaceae bacterium]|nr:hypothetical protein [Ardenticatenaceae bacterium]MCB9443895.1 hypothetical protein [Ardenticatenaceae bacterium]
MLATRILLIWEHPFLRDTVTALLKKEGTELLADFDFQVSLAEIQALNPSHILVESGCQRYQELVTPLLAHEEITIIRLNLEDNRLQVIQRQDHAISQSSDLLKLLQARPETNIPG